MYLYDKNMVVTTNHKICRVAVGMGIPMGIPIPMGWEWEWERFFPCGDPHGNGMGMETEIPFPRQPWS